MDEGRFPQCLEKHSSDRATVEQFSLNNGYDFLDDIIRQNLIARRDAEKRDEIFTAPPCDPWCQTQNVNRAQYGADFLERLGAIATSRARALLSDPVPSILRRTSARRIARSHRGPVDHGQHQDQDVIQHARLRCVSRSVPVPVLRDGGALRHPRVRLGQEAGAHPYHEGALGSADRPAMQLREP